MCVVLVCDTRTYGVYVSVRYTTARHPTTEGWEAFYSILEASVARWGREWSHKLCSGKLCTGESYESSSLHKLIPDTTKFSFYASTRKRDQALWNAKYNRNLRVQKESSVFLDTDVDFIAFNMAKEKYIYTVIHTSFACSVDTFFTCRINWSQKLYCKAHTHVYITRPLRHWTPS